jgi:hypothetical protein
MISIDDIPGWLVAYVAWGLLVAAIFAVLFHELTVAHAATLSISGSATGNGQHCSELELPDISGLTFSEARYLLGPAYYYNVSKSGLVTFDNGSSYQIIDLSWNVTGAI